jgi:hypothetical protein
LASRGDTSITYNILGKETGLASSLKSAADGMDKTAKSADNVKSAFGKFAQGLIAGEVVSKVKDFFTSSISAGSDLSETLSKTRAVFGPAADDMIAFGKSAADALGQTQTQALDAADNLGNLFKNLGITTDKSAEMSKQLVITASDLASFFNADPSEMLEAVSSALAGEYDPLQRYGMAISAASVEQEALASGLARTKAEITPAIQAQATYALILKNTGAAQGDFARTSSGLANQQRILTANWENMKASLGQQLLPVVNEGVGLMNKFLGVVEKLPPGVTNTALGIGAAAVGISAVGLAFGKVKSGLEEFGISLDRTSFKMKDAEGSSTRLGTAVGFLGRAAAAGTVALAIGSGIDQLARSSDNAAASVNATTASLLDLAGGKGLASLDATFKSLSSYGEDDVGGFTDALKRLADPGINTRLNDLGQTLTFGAVKSGLDPLRDQFHNIGTALAEMVAAGRQADAAAIFASLSKQAKDAGLSVDDLNKVMPEYQDALTGVANQQRVATSAGKSMTDGQGELARAAAATAGKMKELDSALNDVKSQFLDGREATARYQEAIDKAQGAVKETSKTLIKNGEALDVHTEKGRTNQRALDDLARSALELVQAGIKEGASEESLQRQLGNTRDQLIKTATNFGMTKGAAQQYADRILAIPMAKATQISAPGANTARGQVDDLRWSVNDLHNKTIYINVVGTQSGMAGAARVAGQYAAGGLLPGTAPSRADNLLVSARSGEYVVNADSTSKYLPLLEAINKGTTSTMPRVTSSAASSSAGGAMVVHNHYWTVSGAIGNEDFLSRTVADAFQRTTGRGYGS